jgi:hypothetical protein
VGLQYHLSENQPTQAQMEEGIRRIGELGLEVHISELDVPIWFLGPTTIPERLALQPEIYRRVANACQAQPACFRITTWGFTDRLTYRCCNAKPLPFDEEYRPKPAWAVLQEVLRPGGPTRPFVPPPPVPQPTAQAAAAARAPLTVTAGLKRQRLRTLLRRRALVVKLQVAGTDTATVQLTARLRGRKLATAVVNIAAGRRQTAVIPLGFGERRRLHRARTARLVVEALATDATGRRAKDRAATQPLPMGRP